MADAPPGALWPAFCKTRVTSTVLHSFAMPVRSAIFYGFYFWFSVPGGREATV